MAGGGKRVRLLWALFGVLLAVLVLKTFFADVYPVHSGSMRPTNTSIRSASGIPICFLASAGDMGWNRSKSTPGGTISILRRGNL